jgi:hypothetical protein
MGVIAVLVLLSVGAVMDVGVQAALRARAVADTLQAVQLHELLPDPGQGSIFLPLRLSDNNTKSGRVFFDAYFGGALERSWSSTKYLRRIYARNDIRAGWWDRRAGLTFVIGGEKGGLRFDERGVRASDRLKLPFPSDQAGVTRIPWGRVVPFLIEEDGTVRLVSAIAVFDAARHRTVFPVAQTARALAARGVDGTWAVYRDGVDPSGFEVQQAPVPGGPPR